MSQDLKKLLQQPDIPPSLFTSFLKPSQMGALSEASKRTRASTRQAQAQLQQLDGSSVTNVQQFMRKLASFPLLKKLIFPRTNFTPTRLELLTEMLTRLPLLTYVDLSLNYIPHGHATLLSQHFPIIQFKVHAIKPDGKTVQGNMVNGVFQGPAIQYFTNGIRLEGNMVNGVFQGPAIQYYPNGFRLEGNMVNGVFQGPAIKYHPFRLEGNMVNGVFQGPAIDYNANGDRLVGTMVNGVFEGPIKKYYANGDLLEGTMVRGILQGPTIKYYANGDRLVGNKVKELFEGPAILYYANGDRLEGNMKKNYFQEKGPAIKYYANGTYEQGHMQWDRFIPDGGPPPTKKRRSQ
jgi:antitoxin component YwqK of YwqJK toxin-antitoxin module